MKEDSKKIWAVLYATGVSKRFGGRFLHPIKTFQTEAEAEAYKAAQQFGFKFRVAKVAKGVFPDA